MNKDLRNIKMTKNEKKEVITETLNNMNYLEIRRLITTLIESVAISNKAYEYLTEDHESELIDSLKYNEVKIK